MRLSADTRPADRNRNRNRNRHAGREAHQRRCRHRTARRPAAPAAPAAPAHHAVRSPTVRGPPQHRRRPCRARSPGTPRRDEDDASHGHPHRQREVHSARGTCPRHVRAVDGHAATIADAAADSCLPHRAARCHVMHSAYSSDLPYSQCVVSEGREMSLLTRGRHGSADAQCPVSFAPGGAGRLEDPLRKPTRAVLPSGTLGEQNGRTLVNIVNKLPDFCGFLVVTGALRRCEVTGE
ncbi:hypothetical protein ABH935_006036 [Catenulispora sp. GAS73]